MNADNDLKSTIQNIISHVVMRMECANDSSLRRCLFQEYKEWLGNSIDDWVLALPQDWQKEEENLY